MSDAHEKQLSYLYDIIEMRNARIAELEAVLREASNWFGSGEAPAAYEGDRIRRRMRDALTVTASAGAVQAKAGRVAELASSENHWRELYGNLLREHDAWASIARDAQASAEKAVARIAELEAQLDEGERWHHEGLTPRARVAKLEAAIRRCLDGASATAFETWGGFGELRAVLRTAPARLDADRTAKPKAEEPALSAEDWNLDDLRTFQEQNIELNDECVRLEKRVAELEDAINEMQNMLTLDEAHVEEALDIADEAIRSGATPRARLDAGRTAKPKTEIVGVFQAGKRGFYHNAEALIARPTPSDVDGHATDGAQARARVEAENKAFQAGWDDAIDAVLAVLGERFSRPAKPMPKGGEER